MYVRENEVANMICPVLTKAFGETTVCHGLACMAWRRAGKHERDQNFGDSLGFCGEYPDPKLYMPHPMTHTKEQAHEGCNERDGNTSQRGDADRRNGNPKRRFWQW